MLDLFKASKFGLKREAAFLSASSRNFQLVPPVPGQQCLYMLRPVADCYILQSSSNAEISNGVTSSTGTRLISGYYYPMVVENVDESFIAVRGASTNDNLDISLISEIFRSSVVGWQLLGPL